MIEEGQGRLFSRFKGIAAGLGLAALIGFAPAVIAPAPARAEPTVTEVRVSRHEGLTRVLLAHLSETNNSPELARRAYERGNSTPTAELIVAEQTNP